MKLRPFLIFALILSLAIVPGLQLAFAASSSSSSTSTSTSKSTSSTTATTTTSSVPKSPYSERLDIYTAGYNDLFLISMSPTSANEPAALTSAESVSGVTAYEITLVKSTGGTASSPLFWNDGYNVLNLPFTPDEGIFINVTASSQAAAQSAATSFEAFLGTNLEQVSAHGNNYTFFGSSDFENAEKILFPLVPASEKGFAGFFTLDSLLSQPFPTMRLSGVLQGSSFTHTIALGSTESKILNPNDTLNVDSALNLGTTALTSSANATSSKVVVHAFDALMSTPDATATLTNQQAAFTSSYSVSISPGAKVDPNVTMLADPPVLSVSRTVDSGSVSSGGTATFTVTFKNTAAANVTAQNIVLDDNWWTAYPSLLSVSAGNSTIQIPTLAGGGAATSVVYALRVTGTAAEDLTLPSATVTYAYSVGNLTLHASTKTNQLELRVNDPGPALEVETGANLLSGSPIGTTGDYMITVTNTGTSPALDLKVGNATDSTLLAGATWNPEFTVPLDSIVGRNTTQNFNLAWTTPEGTQGSLASNPYTLVLSHSGIILPFVQFFFSLPSSPTVEPGVTSIGATYNLYNAGTLSPDNVTVTQPLPAGVTCSTVSKISNGTATCNGSSVTVTAPHGIASTKTFTGVVQLAFSNDSYVTSPALITSRYSGVTLHTYSAAFLLPTGVIISKAYQISPVFDGEDDAVTVTVKNIGTTPVYHLVTSAVADFFATTEGGNLTAQYQVLNPGVTESNNFTILLTSAGSQKAGEVSVSYEQQGVSELYTAPRIGLDVYKPILAKTTTKPSVPEAGKDFTLDVTLENPSPVNVTDVTASFVVPQSLKILNYSSGLQLTGRTFTLTIPSLGAQGGTTATITLKTATSGTYALPSGSLSFQYQGSKITGTVSGSSIVVTIDLLLYFELPIALAVLIAIGAAFYIHRKLPTPPK